jgi:ABC-type uncharacterized transport system substrate-binding protein
LFRRAAHLVDEILRGTKPAEIPVEQPTRFNLVINLRTAKGVVMLNDRENILSALREKALKVREIMKRANVANEEVCQSLLLKMRDEGVVKFDIHSGRWLIA